MCTLSNFFGVKLAYICRMEETYAFQSVIELANNNLWGSHFVVPGWIAEALFEKGEARRVVCTLNDKITYQCAILPYGDGVFVITVNKTNLTKLKLKEGSVVQVAVQKDDSEYGLPMPEEMAELLKQDEEGNRLFHALTPGKIRTLLYIIAQPKSSELRLHRALQVLEHLQQHEGKVDYKQLNLTLRQRN